MLRIQLVVEDYAEIVSLSTMLKKVGFDVDSTQNPLALADSLLRLNPDVLIMTAAGRRVNGFDLAKQVKKNRGLPHVILLHEPGQTPETDPGVEAWASIPIDGPNLLRTIARVCLLNEQVLMEKYQAKIGAITPPPIAADASRIGASSLADGERRARYQKFLDLPLPPNHGLAASKVRDQVKALRARPSADPEGDVDLEQERRDFVDQLFKKKA